MTIAIWNFYSIWDKFSSGKTTEKNHLGGLTYIIFANFCQLLKLLQATTGLEMPKHDQIIVEGSLGNLHTKHQDDRMPQRGNTADLLHPVYLGAKFSNSYL